VQRFGLEPGEAIRFRRIDKARWQDGTAVRLERDGSLAVTDRDGAARAVAVDQVLVRAPGRGIRWEPLLERAARTVQLALF